MSHFSKMAPAILAGSLVVGLSVAANSQMPDYNSLPNPEVCRPLYANYVNAYNAYVEYYNLLHAQYPNGDNPNDTALLLGQKIDAMYDAQAAFSAAGCGTIEAFRGGRAKAPPPNKIKLKYKR